MTFVYVKYTVSTEVGVEVEGRSEHDFELSLYFRMTVKCLSSQLVCVQSLFGLKLYLVDFEKLGSYN